LNRSKKAVAEGEVSAYRDGPPSATSEETAGRAVSKRSDVTGSRASAVRDLSRVAATAPRQTTE
jgi:hypothetical protein